MIGPISSIFDYTTYFAMLYLFGCWILPGDAEPGRSYKEALFQTGWFIESLATQTLIVHIIRTNRIPFVQSRASWPLIFTSICVVGAGIAIVFSPIGSFLGFVPLPPLYWPVLGATLLGYGVLCQTVKMWLARRHYV